MLMKRIPFATAGLVLLLSGCSADPTLAGRAATPARFDGHTLGSGNFVDPSTNTATASITEAATDSSQTAYGGHTLGSGN